ncbi:hypothetical protein G6O69_04950 [Pseudenhygromyxa sp. WMMC2535]|uniref:hypothetical protein n=1 Tax=Pseudenhygromyxa sp. WMMC2535 TaxID=2712867 RepID=UPI0015535A93|nr:hypothetical protein [Pseudenhygromyxa sp. WMMC2535]NVB37168.1 hypothetical protein [Pseudenhygromyxa sp. WMMC2535]
MTRRRPASLASLVSLLACVACSEGPVGYGDRQGDMVSNARPVVGGGPIQWPRRPEPAPAAKPEPTPAPEPEPGPELDPKQAALADVGRQAFDALREDDLDALMALTHLEGGALAERCPDKPSPATKQEIAARFRFCHDEIDWEAVEEAQIFADKRSGGAAVGCEAGLEELGRLQLFLHMRGGAYWRVDFHGAVGVDGKAVGIDGGISCREVDEVPKLRKMRDSEP